MTADAPIQAPIQTKGTVVLVASVHWHYTWQRHHEIATRLARLGYELIYVEPLPKRWPSPRELRRVTGRLLGRSSLSGLVRQAPSHGVSLVSPLLIPDVGVTARALNRRLFVPRLARKIRRRVVQRPLILWHYLPISAAIELHERLAPDLSIYDCVSDWSNHPYARPGAIREDALLKIVDLVFADSPYLFDRMRRLHPGAHQVLPAVAYERFRAARQPRVAPAGPLCCYFGSITPSIDVELLAEVSRTHRLRLVGPVQTRLPKLGAGTELVGPVPADRVPALLQDARVLLLPYRRNAYNRGVMPAKTFECLATGKPSVAIGIDSLRQFGELFYVCDSPSEFLQAIDRAVEEEDPTLCERRLETARRNDWGSRMAEIERLLQTAPRGGASSLAHARRSLARPEPTPEIDPLLGRRIPAIRHLGLRVHLLAIGDLTALVDAAVSRRSTTIIAHHNLHSAYLFRRSAALREFYSRAAYAHFDGMGLLFAARLAGLPGRRVHRVTFADWIRPLLGRAAERGWKVFHLGGLPGVGQRAARRLREELAELRIETHHGYFDAARSNPENRSVVERIAAFEPDLLLVGMGMPRQERWILENLDRVAAPVILPCGACFDYLAGQIRTPPRWAGRLGLEWLFRLATEPRRLFGRYLVEPLFLAGPWLAEVARRRLRGAERGAEPPAEG